MLRFLNTFAMADELIEAAQYKWRSVRARARRSRRKRDPHRRQAPGKEGNRIQAEGEQGQPTRSVPA
jgi:hypothetical protein